MPLDGDTIVPGSPHSHSTNNTLFGFDEEKVEPIAVVGFSARLPGDAASTEEFWQMLCEGRSARTEIPESRLNINAFYHPDPDRTDAVCKSRHLFSTRFPLLITYGDQCTDRAFPCWRHRSVRCTLFLDPACRSRLHGSSTTIDARSII